MNGFTMKMKKKNISLLIILFVFSVLATILGITTYQDIQREKEYVFETMKNKGITLAFSLQTSLRINVSSLKKDMKLIQKLIEKAANRPSIAYIALVDDNERVLAHTHQELIGKPLPLELGEARYIKKDRINTRSVISSTTNERIFEVIEPFIFIPPPTYLPEITFIPGKESTESSSGYNIIAQAPEVYWWVIGFKVDRAIFATRAALYKAIATGIFLLVMGSVALYIIFTLQKYYVIKETLTDTTNSIGKILSSMYSGVIFINRQGKIITFNSAAEKITGFKEEEVRERQYTEIFNDQETSDSDLLNALNSGYSCHDRDVYRIVRDGRKLPLKVSVFPLYNEEGKIIGAGEIFQDLLKIKELEERVSREDRLASLGKFAAGIAHEVRNPLASIKGFAQYLKGKFSLKGSESYYTDIIIEEVERLDKIVSALLNFAKPKPLHIEMHNINSIIEESLALIEDKARKNHISIMKNLRDDLPLMNMDKDQVKQVFLNIFLNAIQEMEMGGKLEVVSRSNENSSVIVEIKDTGRGISHENIQNIFNPFFTTKESGFGLGLSIANSIIESHGGEIKVISEIEKGTTFTIQIPINHDG